MITTQARGIVETQHKLDQVMTDLHGPAFLNGIRKAALAVQADAKRDAPVDTGRLRASITSEVRTVGTTVQGVVGSNVVYAPYMELGTGKFVGKKPYFPPPRALDVWAKRHGFASGYQVAWAIYKKGGTEGREFLQGAFKKNQAYIQQVVGDAVAHIVRK